LINLGNRHINQIRKKLFEGSEYRNATHNNDSCICHSEKEFLFQSTQILYK